jgi:CubicO group peptidase (beta-lactamase class C family)
MTQDKTSRPTWVPLHTDTRAASSTSYAPLIDGFFAPGYERVVETFVSNFSRGELGASFCLIADGYRVVDIWGGDISAGGDSWDSDTLSIFYSCSKIITAIVIHRLVETGELKLDEPLSAIWPELKAGQVGGTLRMALSHTLGLPALERKLKDGAYNDHDYMKAQLEQQEPLWPPGTRVGYHPLTYGFILGELVRRVTGTTLGRYFQEHFANALGLDLYIGLPSTEYGRYAPSRGYRMEREDPRKHVALASQIIGSVQNLWLFNAGRWKLDTINSFEGLNAEIPAANGVGNARSLAALLAIFLDRKQLESVGLSEDSAALLETVASATQRDATLLARSRFSSGLMLSTDNRDDLGADSFIIGRRAFGHVGMGGSFGFCDRELGISAAYVMNQQGHGILLNERGQGLIDACYECAGFSQIRAGAWHP